MQQLQTMGHILPPLLMLTLGSIPSQVSGNLAYEGIKFL